ncbi:MAG: hypothetical protein GY891_07230 [Bacteroidetes bacterium]|nr:hypothetical protein [Bacteroidota bacterium]
MSTGWIKLHRQLLEWEWYDDINTSRLFIHLMLTANHKDNNWRGIQIKRGSRLTSLDKLSSETNLSVSKIRTAIKKLISTNEIASKSHSQHTVFTMINYDMYQDDDKQNDKPVTNESQTNDKRIATNKNDKNDKNVNNDKKGIVAKAPKFDFKNELLLLGVDKQVLEDWLTVRKNRKASNTKTAFNGLIREVEKSCLTVGEAIEVSAQNSWTGFKAQWYANLKPNQLNSKHNITNQNYQSGDL